MPSRLSRNSQAQRDSTRRRRARSTACFLGNPVSAHHLGDELVIDVDVGARHTPIIHIAYTKLARRTVPSDCRERTAARHVCDVLALSRLTGRDVLGPDGRALGRLVDLTVRLGTATGPHLVERILVAAAARSCWSRGPLSGAFGN